MINFPNPEIELLFCCARTVGAETVDTRIRTLLNQGLDWDKLLRLSMKHGVMPLVYRRMSKNFAEEVPSSALLKLRERYQANAARNTFLTGELLRLMNILECEGINVLPYKGPALSIDAYNDLTLRNYSDLDVLIRQKDLAQATVLLTKEGYEGEFILEGERAQFFTKLWYVQPFRNPQSGVYLEVHWKVAPLFFSFDIDVDKFWESPRKLSLAGREIDALSLQDTLLLLCVHGAKDYWSKLEWICALDGFIYRHSEIQWDEAFRRARLLGSERMLLLGLFLTNEVCGTQLPESIAVRVKGSNPVRVLADKVLGELIAQQSGLKSFFSRTSFHLGARERLSDRAKYCARVATATSPSEWDLFQLPPNLFFIYALVRPFRRAGQAIQSFMKRQPESKSTH